MSTDSTEAYRSIHTGAVLGLLLGIVSSVILYFALTGIDVQYVLPIAPLPIAGAAVSLSALRGIRAAREVYTGEQLASTGLSLSLLFLIGSLGYSSYNYATEVPEGYTRTSFLQMKPREVEINNGELIPDKVEALVDEPVFIKGYIRPDSIQYTENFDNFLLVRDNQECCFGDASKIKYFDQVRVQLQPGMTADYHAGLFRLGGKLRVGPGTPELGTPLTYYLEADYLR